MESYQLLKQELNAVELTEQPTLAELNALLQFLYPLFLKPSPSISADKNERDCYRIAEHILGLSVN